MTLLLSGTDGLSDVDGSAATPAIRGTDANTGMFFPAADTIAFAEGGVEAMRLDSAGNMGLGTTSPESKLDVGGAGSLITLHRASDGSGTGKVGSRTGSEFSLYNGGGSSSEVIVAGSSVNFNVGAAERMRIDSSGNVGIGTSLPTEKLHVSGSSTSYVESRVANTQSSTIAAVVATGTTYSFAGVGASTVWFSSGSSTTALGNFSANPIQFVTNGSERMRIDSSGNVGVGVSSVIGKFQVQVGDAAPSASGNMNGVIFSASNGGNGLSFGTADLGGYNWISSGYTNSANTGRPLRIIPGSNGVQLASGGTSWSSLSDERTKVDLKPIADAAKKVLTLRAVTGRYKTDEEKTSRSFLIAQDVQKVLPEAVIVFDDEQGTLGLSYTDTIPLLVAAIKEQQKIIESLTARVAQLEAK